MVHLPFQETKRRFYYSDTQLFYYQMQNFSQALDQLNPAQQEAATHLYGPMLVLAGPGTGKTQVLTTRIANLLQAEVGAEPQNILCLTFTESGAVAMRKRLIQWIGPEAYRVRISTFHGFCQSVLDDYGEIFRDKLQDKIVADDLNKALIYQKTLQSKKWKYFKPLWDEFFYRRDFLMALSQLKREHIDPESFLELLPTEEEQFWEDPKNFYAKKYKEFQAGDRKPAAEKKIKDRIEKLTEFTTLWKAYEDNLSNAGFYDFDDQINWVVNELKNNEALRFDLQEQYQWILVDEYQDTNGSQNEILWSLIDGIEEPNLFVVGDDDQSIYRFQGASIANITEFQAKLPSAKTVKLETNYRSVQGVLDAAYAVVELNTERVDANKKLTAFSPLGSRGDAEDREDSSSIIHQSEFLSSYTETNYLIQTIQQKLASGIPADQIAILVRNNKEIEHLARELPRFGIDISAQITQNIFENPSVNLLLLMLRIFSTPDHDTDLMQLLHAPHLDIPREKLLQLSLQSNKERKSILEILSEKYSNNPPLEKVNCANSTREAPLGDKGELEGISSQDLGGLFATSEENSLNLFYHFFITTRPDFFHLRPPILAEKVFYESGLAQYLTKTRNFLDFHHIRTTIDWIREQNATDIYEILEKISLHQELNIPVRPEPLPTDRNAIQIMTSHRAKGLEFEIVLIPGLQDGKWGNTKKRSNIPLPQLGNCNKGDDNQEERRLFFVGLTRAKSEIFLSYSASDPSGREKNVSQFWHEIPESMATKTDTQTLETEAHQLLPTLSTTLSSTSQSPPQFTQEEKSILTTLTENYKWSASSLQAYIDCPRRFLYQNLYRFPRKSKPQMALGTALHQGLERYFRHYQENSIDPPLVKGDLEGISPNTLPSYSVLKEEFIYALRGQNVDKKLYEELLEHGLKISQIYYDQRIQSNNFHPDDLLEFNFGKLQPEIDGIRITGNADKISWLNDEKTVAKILDYKSGKPKAIKHGENYWRQLVFYDLLSKHTKGINWTVDHCELEFLTPDPKNDQIQTKSYTVTPEDREQVISELKSADTAIKNFEFPIIENPNNDADIDFWNHFGS